MVTKSVAIETAKTFVEACMQKGLSLEKAFLFGSYARNNQHEGSDIDILLVSNQFGGNRLKNLDLFYEVNIQYPQIEVHPYSSQKFNTDNAFLKEILKGSIEII